MGNENVSYKILSFSNDMKNTVRKIENDFDIKYNDIKWFQLGFMSDTCGMWNISPKIYHDDIVNLYSGDWSYMIPIELSGIPWFSPNYESKFSFIAIGRNSYNLHTNQINIANSSCILIYSLK